MISFWESLRWSFCSSAMIRKSTAASVQIERFTEVNSSHLCVSGEVLGDALPEDLAFFDDIGAIGDLQCFSHVMISDEDSDPTAAELGDNSLYFENGNRIDSCKGLIQQDKCRVDREAPGDLHATPFPT